MSSSNPNDVSFPSLLTFLHHTRSLLKNPPTPPPILVLGNTSADLDSFACSVLYAYFRSIRPSSKTDNENRQTYVPVVQVPFPAGRELRRQRPEFVAALARREGDRGSGEEDSGEMLSEVVTTRELKESGLLELGRNEKIQGVLVDWNTLPVSSPDSVGAEDLEVVGCIDHHVDEGFVHQKQQDTGETKEGINDEIHPRIIQTGIGSCTSLIVQELRNSKLWPDTNVASPVSAEEAQLAQLALSAILIDTTNLTSRDRTSPLDLAAASFLQTKLGSSFNRDEFFNVVKAAKEAGLDNLTVKETLGKDYKEWNVNANNTKLGVASIVRPLRWLAEKAGKESEREGDEKNALLEELKSYANSKELDIFSIMTTFTSPNTGQFKRELLLWSLNPECVEMVMKFEELAEKEGMRLGKWEEVMGLGMEEGGKEWRNVWWQGDTSKSRKQVAPLIKKAIEETKK
jgi:exopolyphosphatase